MKRNRIPDVNTKLLIFSLLFYLCFNSCNNVRDQYSTTFKTYLNEVFGQGIPEAPHVYFISPSHSCPFCEKYSSEKLTDHIPKEGISVILAYDKMGLIPIPDTVLNRYMIDTTARLKRMELGKSTRLVFTSNGKVDSIKELTAQNITLINDYFREIN